MRRKYVLACTILLVSMFAASCGSRSSTVKVTVPLATSFGDYKHAVVETYDLDISRNEQASGNASGSLRISIYKELNSAGVVHTRDDKIADLMIVCSYRMTWMPPVVGRHFDIHLKHIGYVNLVFIDTGTGAVVAEVDFEKGRWDAPNAYIIENMFAKLLEPAPYPRPSTVDNQ